MWWHKCLDVGSKGDGLRQGVHGEKLLAYHIKCHLCKIAKLFEISRQTMAKPKANNRTGKVAEENIK